MPDFISYQISGCGFSAYHENMIELGNGLADMRKLESGDMSLEISNSHLIKFVKHSIELNH